MYDFKTTTTTTLQFDKKFIKQQLQQQQQQELFSEEQKSTLPYHPKHNNNNNNNTTTLTDLFAPHLTSAYSTCSIIKLTNNSSTNSCSSSTSTTSTSNTNTIAKESSNNILNNPADTTHMTLLSLRRRRWLVQRHACLFSILLAFIFGLALGVFMPLFGWANILQTLADGSAVSVAAQHMPSHDVSLNMPHITTKTTKKTKITTSSITNRTAPHPPSDFPTIYELQNVLEPQMLSSTVGENAFSVAFIKEEAQFPHMADSRQLSVEVNLVPLKAEISTPASVAASQHRSAFIKSNIYWDDEVERILPRGFTPDDSHNWNEYVSEHGVVTHLEVGCGRMQNRLVIFADGTRACARYRQNTDQIQGELFSFYLGQLLNLSNLAPSAAAVIDLNSSTWQGALADITAAQWKQQRPVVLTRWLPDLEPAGIPQPFQAMERHLNKYDVWNMTTQFVGHKSKKVNGSHKANELTEQVVEKGLLKRLGSGGGGGAGGGSSKTVDHQSINGGESASSKQLRQRLIELAQWSDLIVFDYLIANLDRVVNNLYNFQWNADIMAAPAHNLARQMHSQLLVFLDNESGLLHGYRLLKKYEAYHGLLLDNLCVFRQPTIDALRELREQGVGRRIRDVFERTTTNAVRDVLPSLPDKSIKILVDRIDRVLGQVQKCRDLLADR